jgi:hypothetical protein
MEPGGIDGASDPVIVPSPEPAPGPGVSAAIVAELGVTDDVKLA